MRPAPVLVATALLTTVGIATAANAAADASPSSDASICILSKTITIGSRTVTTPEICILSRP